MAKAEAEEDLIGKGSLMLKVTGGMAFDVIIATNLGI